MRADATSDPFVQLKNRLGEERVATAVSKLDRAHSLIQDAAAALSRIVDGQKIWNLVCAAGDTVRALSLNVDDFAARCRAKKTGLRVDDMLAEEVQARGQAVVSSIKSDADPVLIWCAQRQAWWKLDAIGYTPHLQHAGIFRRGDAVVRMKPGYLGRTFEPCEVAEALWARREDDAAWALLGGLGLLRGCVPARPSRESGYVVLPIAPAVQPVFNPENLQLVVDGLVLLGTAEGKQLADEILLLAETGGSASL